MKNTTIPQIGALMGVLFASTLALSAAPQDAKISTVTGTAQFATAGSTDFKPLVAGQTLPSGSVIKTGSDGVVLFVPVRGTAMRVAQNTEITIKDMDFAATGNTVTSRKADIELTSGTVSALLDKNISEQATDFKIRTPQGVAAARGTFYAVCVDQDKSYVKVKSGKVGVASKIPEKGTQAAFIPEGAAGA